MLKIAMSCMGNTLLHVKAEFSVCALFAALDSQEARLVMFSILSLAPCVRLGALATG